MEFIAKIKRNNKLTQLKTQQPNNARSRIAHGPNWSLRACAYVMEPDQRNIKSYHNDARVACVCDCVCVGVRIINRARVPHTAGGLCVYRVVSSSCSLLSIRRC